MQSKFREITLPMKGYTKLIILFFAFFGGLSTYSLATHSYSKTSTNSICIKPLIHSVTDFNSPQIPPQRNLISFRFHHGIEEDVTFSAPIRLADVVIISLPEPVGERTSSLQYFSIAPDKLPFLGDFLNLSLLHAPPFSC